MFRGYGGKRLIACFFAAETEIREPAVIRIRLANNLLIERENQPGTVFVEQFKGLSVEHTCADDVNVCRIGVEDSPDIFHLFFGTVIQADQFKNITACLKDITHIADKRTASCTVEIAFHSTEDKGDSARAFKGIFFDGTRGHNAEFVTQGAYFFTLARTDTPGGIRIQRTRYGGLTDTGKFCDISGCDFFCHNTLIYTDTFLK